MRLSVGEIILHLMVGWLTIIDTEMMWKELVASLRSGGLIQLFLEGLGKPRKFSFWFPE
jgi:hypothetical protein